MSEISAGTQARIEDLQEDNVQLRMEADILRREICANVDAMREGRKTMRLARGKIANLRRALEKACEQIVDSYYYRCPNELNNWERSKNCLSACDVGTGIEADCWMQHFMEKNDG